MTTQALGTKPHYDLLDGLRGVAALAVLFYHLNEAIAFAAGAAEQEFFHGFLGVDFFFILSGFVMGYAYDERWDRMSVGQFVKRRLIRLHPMVVFGVVVGLVCFAIQGFCSWDGERATMSMLLIGILMALCLLPVPQSVDVRGNYEAFPLNGPHWSLFFEYIGSLLYAIWIRKWSTKSLRILVGIMALLLCICNLQDPSAGIAYGWSSEPINLVKGSLRLLYGYPMGLLMAREFRTSKPLPITGVPVFTICSIALILLFCVPSFTSVEPHLKVIYELFCVVIAFPMIVKFGACGIASTKSLGAIRFLGRLSYPLYAVHYPLIYLYIHWISTGQHPFGEAEWATPVAVGVISLLLGTIAMLCFDEPVRKWLTKKFIG